MKRRTAYQIEVKTFYQFTRRELMVLGESALDSLCKHELFFDDHKGDIKESLLMKFGFLSIQSGCSKRAPCGPVTGFFIRVFKSSFRVTSCFLCH